MYFSTNCRKFRRFHNNSFGSSTFVTVYGVAYVFIDKKKTRWYCLFTLKIKSSFVASELARTWANNNLFGYENVEKNQKKNFSKNAHRRKSWATFYFRCVFMCACVLFLFSNALNHKSYLRQKKNDIAFGWCVVSLPVVVVVGFLGFTIIMCRGWSEWWDYLFSERKFTK